MDSVYTFRFFRLFGFTITLNRLINPTLYVRGYWEFASTRQFKSLILIKFRMNNQFL